MGIAVAACLMTIMTAGIAVAGDQPQRIVACGGAVTETIYALGEESRLVGVDSSSTYPEAAMQLKGIGIHRFLSAEGVLSLQPDLMIVTAEAGPPAVLDQIRNAGVKVIEVSNDHSTEGAIKKITEVADAIGAPEKGKELADKVAAQVASAQKKIAEDKPKAVFIYARGPMMLVAGTDTAGGSMLELAGAINPITDYAGYKPLSAEALVVAAPDYIVLTNHGLEGMGGIEGALKVAGIAQTPAGQNRNIIAMDDLKMLGFGPRIGEAIEELSSLLHKEAE